MRHAAPRADEQISAVACPLLAAVRREIHDWFNHRMRFLGVDLAWGEGGETKPANRSGVVALDEDGTVTAAGWTVGLDETLAWIRTNAKEATMLFVDAPLVIPNLTGQRLAERQVGQCYGRWWVSANSTNLSSPRKAGVRLRERLEESGWLYDDGAAGPPTDGLTVSECYPYTTIVGVQDLGYGDKRPPYKRSPKGLKGAEARAVRIAACDELIRRVAALKDAEPPLDLTSHPATAQLIDEPSPSSPALYKKREDLLDAALCAWTAALWHRFGKARCQILGLHEEGPSGGQKATIVAPARPSQRLEMLQRA